MPCGLYQRRFIRFIIRCTKTIIGQNRRRARHSLDRAEKQTGYVMRFWRWKFYPFGLPIQVGRTSGWLDFRVCLRGSAETEPMVAGGGGRRSRFRSSTLRASTGTSNAGLVTRRILPRISKPQFGPACRANQESPGTHDLTPGSQTVICWCRSRSNPGQGNLRDAVSHLQAARTLRTRPAGRPVPLHSRRSGESSRRV